MMPKQPTDVITLSKPNYFFYSGSRCMNQLEAKLDLASVIEVVRPLYLETTSSLTCNK